MRFQTLCFHQRHLHFRLLLQDHFQKKKRTMLSYLCHFTAGLPWASLGTWAIQAPDPECFPSPTTAPWYRPRPAHVFSRGPGRKHCRLCRPHCLCHNHAPLLLQHETVHRQSLNPLVWLRSIWTSSTKMGGSSACHNLPTSHIDYKAEVTNVVANAQAVSGQLSLQLGFCPNV